MTETLVPAFEYRPIHVAGSPAVAPWGIAVETPVELRLNGAPWTVMLASPTDLDDFAVGLALTERLIADAAGVAGLQIAQRDGDWTVDLDVPTPLRPTRARSVAGATGCGICGLESLGDFRSGLAGVVPVVATQVVTDAAVLAAWAALPDLQPVNAVTRSVHAAAWCSPDGAVLLVREDVGRHNALDKLVGALARQGRLGEPGFVAMTSRCSVELVAKAAVARALLLATISAPTTLALAASAALGVPLACAGPGRQVVRFPREFPDAVG